MVELTLPDGSTITTTTSITGFYIFEGLPLDTYTVTVDTTTLPSDKLTTATADPDGGTDGTSVTTLTNDNPDGMAQDFG